MSNMPFKHNDPDALHGQALSLHDCHAHRIVFSEGMLRCCFPEGFWITPQHAANDLDKVVRTDAAVVDFALADADAVTIRVFERNLLRQTVVKDWSLQTLIDRVNRGRCTVEFLYQYRWDNDQLWECVIHAPRRPYYRACQIHLSSTQAVFHWNDLRPDCEW